MLKRVQAPQIISPSTIFLSFILLGFGSAIAHSQTAASPSAAETFKTNCVMCHGADGTGSALGKRLQVPDLHSKAVQSQSSATLAQIISKGKNNMPPFGNSLDSKQIEGLVKYIRRFRSAAGTHKQS